MTIYTYHDGLLVLTNGKLQDTHTGLDVTAAWTQHSIYPLTPGASRDGAYLVPCCFTPNFQLIGKRLCDDQEPVPLRTSRVDVLELQNGGMVDVQKSLLKISPQHEIVMELPNQGPQEESPRATVVRTQNSLYCLIQNPPLTSKKTTKPSIVPEAFRLTPGGNIALSGAIYGHRKIPDGMRIETSPMHVVDFGKDPVTQRNVWVVVLAKNTAYAPKNAASSRIIAGLRYQGPA